nr:hypothetical protein [uncultured Undibacterium sp.]
MKTISDARLAFFFSIWNRFHVTLENILLLRSSILKNSEAARLMMSGGQAEHEVAGFAITSLSLIELN